MKKELYKFIPFVVACILVLGSIIQYWLKPITVNSLGWEVRYVVSDSIIYAGIALLIVLGLILLKKHFWEEAFLVVIILAFTPWLSFYNQTFSIGIGFVSIELTALVLLLFHLAVNPGSLESLKNLISEKPENQNSKELKFETSVKNFETRFSTKSVEELRKIVEENSLVPEAVEAAKRLLSRK